MVFSAKSKARSDEHVWPCAKADRRSFCPYRGGGPWAERIPWIALHHPSDEDLLLHPSEQRPLAGDPESAGNPGTLHPRLLSPPPSGTTCGGADCLRRGELMFIVCHISESRCGPPPAHRDKTAMNGAQLLIARGDFSGLVSGPPAFRRLNILLTSGNEGALPGPRMRGTGATQYKRAPLSCKLRLLC